MVSAYRVTLGTTPVLIASGFGLFELKQSEGAIWLGDSAVTTTTGWHLGTTVLSVKLERTEELYAVSNAPSGAVVSVLELSVR